MGFWGREEESRQFKMLNLDKKSRLVVVYGRRRIGKTYFIE